MIFYVTFLLYVLLGVGFSVALFSWALKNRQFSGQRRAAFLPLEGDAPLADPGPAASRWTPALWGTLTIVVFSTCLFVAACVVLAAAR